MVGMVDELLQESQRPPSPIFLALPTMEDDADDAEEAEDAEDMWWDINNMLILHCYYCYGAVRIAGVRTIYRWRLLMYRVDLLLGIMAYKQYGFISVYDHMK